MMTDTTNARISVTNVIVFHVSVLLVGAAIVMPAILSLVASSGFGGPDLSSALRNEPYNRLVVLSVLLLLPTMFAFGTDLKFSVGGFVVGTILVALTALRTVGGQMASGANVVWMPIGGGILGVAVATASGSAGLIILRFITSPIGKRIVIGLVGGVILIIIGVYIFFYVTVWIPQQNEWAEYNQGVADELKAHGDASAAIGDSYETGDSSFAFETLDGNQLRMLHWYESSGLCLGLVTTAETNTSADTPFGQMRGREQYMERSFGGSNSDVNVRVAPDWTEIGYDLVSVCLRVSEQQYADRGDWPRQHNWAAATIGELVETYEIRVRIGEPQ